MSLLEAVSLDEVQLGLCMQHEHPVCLVVLRHAVGGRHLQCCSVQARHKHDACHECGRSVSECDLVCVHFKASRAPIIFALLAGDELENALIIAAWQEATAAAIDWKLLHARRNY